jgi:hypothetical protein
MWKLTLSKENLQGFKVIRTTSGCTLLQHNTTQQEELLKLKYFTMERPLHPKPIVIIIIILIMKIKIQEIIFF